MLALLYCAADAGANGFFNSLLVSDLHLNFHSDLTIVWIVIAGIRAG